MSEYQSRNSNQLRALFLSETNSFNIKQQVQEYLMAQRVPNQIGNNYDDLIKTGIQKVSDTIDNYSSTRNINDPTELKRRSDKLIERTVKYISDLIIKDIKENGGRIKMPNPISSYNAQSTEPGLTEQSYAQRVIPSMGVPLPNARETPNTMFTPNQYDNKNTVFHEGNGYPVQLQRDAERKIYQQECHCVSIDSRDRDLEIYPNPASFQVRFSPSGDSWEFPTTIDTDGNIITRPAELYIGDDKGASVNRTYNNIYKMACCMAIMPYGEKRVCDNDPTSESSMHANAAAVSTLNEPYLMLVIDELDGPYEGTNKTARKGFTKLVHDNAYSFALLNQTNNSTFIQMIPTCRENRYWKPTALGKLDRLTLTLRDSCGLVYSFGQDKLYIASFEQSDTVIEPCCPSDPSKNATKVTITCDSPEYYDKACYHDLDDGDVVYFYATRPCDKSTIQPNRLFPMGPEFKFTVYENFITTDLANLSFPTFLKIGDFVTIENTTYQIVNLTTKQVTLDQDTGYTQGSPLQNPTIRYANQNRKGITSDSNRCLFYVGGWRKCSRDGSGYGALEFDINFPWEDMPEYISNGNYKTDEVFLIKQKLQTSYTFQVVTLEKNEGPLISELV